MMINKFWNWKPLESVGPFIFNVNINSYFTDYELKLESDEHDVSVPWDSYSLSGHDVRIHCESDKIVSIACYQECIYKGVNLIGNTFSKLLSIIEVNPDGEPDFIFVPENEIRPQSVYEFEELELQLWVKKDVVVTAICSPLYVETPIRAQKKKRG